MDATKRPWYVDGDGMICGPMAEVVAGQCEDEDEMMVPAVYKHEDRELIVKAVNMHERLVAFVETMKRDCEKRQDTGNCEGCYGTIPGGILCGTRALLKEARGQK